MNCRPDSRKMVLRNFAQVDYALWRGGRPDESGARWLAAQGVRTVINLEWSHRDDNAFRDGPQVKLVRLCDWEPLPWFAPSVSDKHVRAFLAVVRSAERPIYVHCRSGQNRTGVMVAAYQLIIRNALLPDVLDEFWRFRGFWARGDERYIRTLDARRGSFQ